MRLMSAAAASHRNHMHSVGMAVLHATGRYKKGSYVVAALPFPSCRGRFHVCQPQAEQSIGLCRPMASISLTSCVNLAVSTWGLVADHRIENLQELWREAAARVDDQVPEAAVARKLCNVGVERNLCSSCLPPACLDGRKSAQTDSQTCQADRIRSGHAAAAAWPITAASQAAQGSTGVGMVRIHRTSWCPHRRKCPTCRPLGASERIG